MLEAAATAGMPPGCGEFSDDEFALLGDAGWGDAGRGDAAESNSATGRGEEADDSEAEAGRLRLRLTAAAGCATAAGRRTPGGEGEGEGERIASFCATSGVGCASPCCSAASLGGVRLASTASPPSATGRSTCGTDGLRLNSLFNPAMNCDMADLLNRCSRVTRVEE